MEISSSFIELGRQGKVLFSIFRNTTEAQQLEAQLRQSQKLERFDQLAGGVAHDFHNLLAVIRGNAELMLMDGDAVSTEGREFPTAITSAAERTANLTRQLLIFSRKQFIQHHGWVEGVQPAGRRHHPQELPARHPAARPGVGSFAHRGRTPRRVLESYGYKVHEAASAREAIEVWWPSVQDISLLITDMVMPEGISSRELGNKLRAQKPDLKEMAIR